LSVEWLFSMEKVSGSRSRALSAASSRCIHPSTASSISRSGTALESAEVGPWRT
jgi:hypothetical protein